MQLWIQLMSFIYRQLRDLLLCPENKKEVVFPYQNNVIQVSSRPPFWGFVTLVHHVFDWMAMLVQYGNRKGYVPPQRLDICSNEHYCQVRSASLTLTVSTSINLITMCSLFVSSGYLAVGGQRSELVVRELHGNWAVTTTTGGSINNGVTVAETNGEKRLMVSNNDETIKVFSIPSMHLIDNLCLPTAVNGGKSKKK